MAKYRSRGGGLDEDTLKFVWYVGAVIYVLGMVPWLIYMAVEAKSGYKMSTSERNWLIFGGVMTVVVLIGLRIVPFIE